MKISAFSISSRKLVEFAKKNGAREVHRSWRDKMLQQGREVSKQRKNFLALDLNDVELDAQIAYDVILDFLVWIQSHGHDKSS